MVSRPVLAGQVAVGAPGCMQNVPEWLATWSVRARVDSLTVTGCELVLVTEIAWLLVAPGCCWTLIWLGPSSSPPLGFGAWMDLARLTAAPMFSSPAPCCSPGA